MATEFQTAVHGVEVFALEVKSDVQDITRWCIWRASIKLEEGWRKRLAVMLEHGILATFVAVLLVIDLICAVLTCVIHDTDLLNPKYEHEGEDVVHVAETVSITILSLFLVEQALTFVALGCLFWKHPWHVIDFIVVTVSFILELTHQFEAAELTVALLLAFRYWKACATIFDLVYVRHVLQEKQSSVTSERSEIMPQGSERNQEGVAAIASDAPTAEV